MSTKEITDANFESDVLNADKPVLVDFWAEWCGPCKMIGPSLEEIGAEQDGVIIGKLNIDNNPEVPTQFGVRGIPTMILFRGGEAIATKVGALPKNKIVEWLSESLGD